MNSACTPVQLAKFGAKLNSGKSPLGRPPGIQDPGNLLEPDETGFHIESQTG